MCSKFFFLFVVWWRLCDKKCWICCAIISSSTNKTTLHLSSRSRWSNSDDDARKMMEVTLSKHWNHFCLCVLCPPTSTNRKGTFWMGMVNSVIALVALRQWRMSFSVGMYSWKGKYKPNLVREYELSVSVFSMWQWPDLILQQF